MPKSPKLNNRNITNPQSARQAFDLRKGFLNKTASISYSNLFDASLFPYYGRVNNKGNFIYPSEQYLVPLKKNKETSTETIYALGFVVDAFTDLQNYFNKANEIGILVQKKNDVSTINPIKGWESMHDAYASNIRALFTALLSSYLEKPTEKRGSKSARPDNFDQYMKAVKHMFFSKGKRFSLTRSAFLMSKHTTIHSSGLAIEIEPAMDYSDDGSKTFIYHDSPNYDFYMQALRKFGFMSDKDYPGRIIADLGSPKMQEYMAFHGLTLENVFDEYYYKASDYDYELVRVYLVQFYNNYAGLYPVKSETTGRGVLPSAKYYLRTDQFYLREEPLAATFERKSGKCLTTTVLKRRHPLLDSDLAKKYNDDYWLPVYAEFLNYELGNPLNKHELEKTIKNAKDLKINVDFDTAIGYIGDKFNFYRYPATNLSLVNYEQPTQRTTQATSTQQSGGSSSNGGY